MKRSKSKIQERGPHYVAKRGSTQVLVYRGERTVKGKIYNLFTVSHYRPDGKRVRLTFGQESEAKREAERIASELAQGHQKSVRITTAEAEEFLATQRKLSGCGFSLLEIADEWLSATRRLPPGVRLAEAVADYLNRHPANAPRVQVSEAVEAVIQEKERAKLSEVYVRKLRVYLDAFSRAFACPLASVTAPLVGQWVCDLPAIGNRSRANYHGAVVTLFRFAYSKRWITREVADEISEIPMPKVEALGEVGIFYPAEIRRLLEIATDDIRASLAIGAFAGLRTEEIHRLNWENIRLPERVIVVGANQAKTASRRVVPISDNLAEWLQPLQQASGPVDPSPTSKATTHRWRRAATRVEVVWKHNALRHSFISYRLAVTMDPAKVAFEAGNSPAMVHRHYKALTTEAQGHDWFNVRPSHFRVVEMPGTEPV
jgi:integrase